LKRKYDVIEVDNMPDFLVFTTIFPKLLGAKVILYVFDNMPEVLADHSKISPNHWAIKLLALEEKVSAAWADHVIATQNNCKELLQSRGLAASKISVVLNVPDESVFITSSSPVRDNNRFRLITHGSILERYNIQTLIKAVPLLIQEIPELEVEVVGDGEYRHQLEKLAQTLGVSDYVRFTGLVPFEQVCTHISQAHICVAVIPAGANPSIPNKLFEYLALGKPTVVTSIPAITAYFDSQSLVFYEPDNEHDLARCILELYGNPEKRAKLAASGSTAYQKIRWDTMKYEYLKVIDQLAE
jgi:glycosyltransferase involved in cell wall biosynthesis